MIISLGEEMQIVFQVFSRLFSKVRGKDFSTEAQIFPQWSEKKICKLRSSL